MKLNTKQSRDLKAELLSSNPESKHSSETLCSLEQKLSCCDGTGIKPWMEGAFLKAKVCSCVESCPTCYGLARKTVDGKSVACRTPSPVRIVGILNQAMVPARYASAKIDSFANFTGNGRLITTAMRQWMKEFNLKDPKGLLLGGPVGVGKTYLLAAIAKSFAYRGLTVRFVDFFQLLNELKAGYSNDQGDSLTIQQLIDVDILIIDELGKGRNSDWELSIIDQLVMGRYNQNKIIVASTNYGLQPSQQNHVAYQGDLTAERRGFDLDQDQSLESRVGSRIFSRLVETCMMMELNGDDFRKRALQERRSILGRRGGE